VARSSQKPQHQNKEFEKITFRKDYIHQDFAPELAKDETKAADTQISIGKVNDAIIDLPVPAHTMTP